ncbi:primase alpha helix C-terminal domain-containing protein [Mammaliicoccus sciuri]|uniref:primase alpha helix C-terminal domain-containing protein n=1 Tax=Mammaliicoccus sciuri TaxID=1296 RepID=UPI00066E8F89|nr:primase alpha helix C-terminal domain-containing protein [Mammaliicoccus sciuri]
MSYKPIKIENDVNITILEYKNVYADSFKKEHHIKYSDLVKNLSIPAISEDKCERGVFLAGTNSDDKKIRNDANMIDRNMLILDYDDLADDIDFLETVNNKLGNVAYTIYSTFNHTYKGNRYRLLIPINRSIKADLYRKTIQMFGELIGLSYDKASEVPSQAMTYSVKQNKESAFVFEYNDKPILDYDFLMKAIKQHKPKNNSVGKRTQAFWDDVAEGVVNGSRNQTLTSLVGLLLAKNVGDKLAYWLAYSYNQTLCKPPLTDKELNKIFASIYKKHYRINIKE